RVVHIGGLFQHAAIEMQPRQLAIDEALRTLSQGRLGRAHRLDRRDWRRFFIQSNGLTAIHEMKECRNKAIMAAVRDGSMTANDMTRRAALPVKAPVHAGVPRPKPWLTAAAAASLRHRAARRPRARLRTSA